MQFHNIISAMQAAGRNTAPRFPGGICVADIPHEPDQAGLVAKHTSDEYHPIDQPEGEERSRIARELQYVNVDCSVPVLASECAHCGGSEFASGTASSEPSSWLKLFRYKRWKWATTNVNRYINILRAVGHDDERIQRMLEGIPMCFRNAESYTALRKGLAQLAPAVEAEMGWSNCSFVFTGSCVPGFSQNPRKGIRVRCPSSTYCILHRVTAHLCDRALVEAARSQCTDVAQDLPSKITHPTNSDVDICIVADGVFCTVSRLHTEPNSSGEPVHAFPTTCRPFMSGMRYGCKDLRAFCKSAAVSAVRSLIMGSCDRVGLLLDMYACFRLIFNFFQDFQDKWASILPGGLQLTFAEDDGDTPPWEARVPLDELANDTATAAQRRTSS